MEVLKVLGRYKRRTWQHEPSLEVPPRYRRACSYDAFIPLPIEELKVCVSGSVAASVSEAEAAIRELNAGSHRGLAPLARLLLRTESIASSKVEGMQVDARALARAEASSDIGQRAATTALEVLGNIDAMQLAIENATAEQSVAVEQITEIHRALLAQAPNSRIAGRIRTEQNWIGGNDYNPCGAEFVPPPPEEIDGLLGDLSRFCSADRLPPLVQAAIAHAQFETIHPFEDGNGRTGRALIQVILRRRGLSPVYVPPISVILAINKERYIHGLTAYREGRVEDWLEVFSVAAARAAHNARGYLGEVSSLQEKWRSMLRQTARVRADAAAWKLIDIMPEQPIVTLPGAVARVARTKPAVNQAIKLLVDAGVLVPRSQNKRNRAWEAVDLLDLIVRMESGETPEGDPDQVPIPDVSEPDSRTSGAGRERLEPGPAQGMDLLPFSDPIHRLAPGAWLVSPGDEAEITLRVAVAAPNVLPLGGSGSTQLITQLRGQRREELLIELLNASPVTSWLRSLRSTWAWHDDIDWTPTGWGSPEFSELWFAPFGLENHRPTLMARCAFATGGVEDDYGTVVPSIQAALDLMLNIRELGVDRRPDGVRHTTDEPPGPAALSLVEVADALSHLFGFVGVTASAAERLLPPPRPQTARVGMWISVPGGLAERVINLRAFRRIPRSSGLSRAMSAFALDLRQGPNGQDFDLREIVANLLYEGLELGGYRDLDEAIDALRQDPGGGSPTGVG